MSAQGHRTAYGMDEQLPSNQRCIRSRVSTMAERSSDQRVRPSRAVVQQRGPWSCGEAQRSQRVAARPQVKSASGPATTLTDELLAKEEQYKLLNAELEAKTADIVRQAAQLMREQSEVLSKPPSPLLLTDMEDEEASRLKPHQRTAQDPSVQVGTKKKATSSSGNTANSGKQGKEPHSETLPTRTSHIDDLAAEESFLARTIHSMEEKMTDASSHEHAVDDESNTGDGISDAQMRVLMAKLRIMQEELDQLSSEYYKKDDENTKLNAKIKGIEEDRARLQRMTSIQQTHIENHRALANASAKKCDGLQLQVSTLKKETEDLRRSHKQAAAVHSTVELRLNRALEEAERLKAQLNKTEQLNKDKISEEHQSKEKLLAENKLLRTQKEQLIVGFKKQLKLIDILKRQKMHFEAAKLLTFTEEEFMKALDWERP